MPRDPGPTERKLLMLPTARPPAPAPPSLTDLAWFVDEQAEQLKELCQKLRTAFEACAQDIDPRLDDQEMFDPIAARFLWDQVPDLQDIASRVSVLGFWLQMLRGRIDVERERGVTR